MAPRIKPTRRLPAATPLRKKANPLTKLGITTVDYKDTALLRTFISDRGKIRSRRVTGLTVQQQRQVAMAIKNAREMALLPYTNRVTTQRGGRRDRDGDDRRPRGDRPDRSERPERDEAAPATSEFEGIENAGEETEAVTEGSEA